MAVVGNVKHVTETCYGCPRRVGGCFNDLESPALARSVPPSRRGPAPFRRRYAFHELAGGLRRCTWLQTDVNGHAARDDGHYRPKSCGFSSGAGDDQGVHSVTRSVMGSQTTSVTVVPWRRTCTGRWTSGRGGTGGPTSHRSLRCPGTPSRHRKVRTRSTHNGAGSGTAPCGAEEVHVVHCRCLRGERTVGTVPSVPRSRNRPITGSRKTLPHG